MTYTPRHIEVGCRRALNEGNAVFLVGPPRSGKSTLADAVLKDIPLNQKIVLDFNDSTVVHSLLGQESLTSLIEKRAGQSLGSFEILYLELHAVERVSWRHEEIKSLYADHKDRLRILATSHLRVDFTLARSFPGRVRIYEISPFLLSEAFAHVRGENPSAAELPGLMSKLMCGQFTPDDFRLLLERAAVSSEARRSFLNRHLICPLFPESCSEKEPEEWLRNYLRAHLEFHSSLVNTSNFRNAIRLFATRVGMLFRFETAAEDLGTTSTTLRKYVGLLEQTNNLLQIEPFAINAARASRFTKLYFRDNGILWALRGYEDERLRGDPGILQSYVEEAAIVEFAKWCNLEPTSPELRYWHKSELSKVDLVISNRGYHIPIEIKLDKTYTSSWLRGLDAFEEDHRRFGLEIPYRLICHFGEPRQIDARTYALPLWHLV